MGHMKNFPDFKCPTHGDVALRFHVHMNVYTVRCSVFGCGMKQSENRTKNPVKEERLRIYKTQWSANANEADDPKDAKPGHIVEASIQIKYVDSRPYQLPDGEDYTADLYEDPNGVQYICLTRTGAPLRTFQCGADYSVWGEWDFKSDYYKNGKPYTRYEDVSNTHVVNSGHHGIYL